MSTSQTAPCVLRLRCGFTILELIMSVAIIALLAGLLLPALSLVKRSGQTTRELAAARQLMVAYSAYAYDHNGVLMPGFYRLNGTLPAFDEAGNELTGERATRYPWRLAPYLDYNLSGLYLDKHVLSELQSQPLNNYWISVVPSLGINAVFVGGDYQAAAMADPNMQRYFGTVHLTRLSQARHPPRLIVFASARYSGEDLPGPLPGGRPFMEGYFRVDPPYVASRKWKPRYDPQGKDLEFGHVSLRHHFRKAVIGFFDGHTGSLDEAQIQDMRHWADQATSPDWTVKLK
ncbi:MAG: prepilin-type N-terminal cleavage/methylation domain-containing protein [Planctomycetes bacterium]|nr:prepilin-type N-terminal cleavage/methylation domain-containing protein [Planctomycetota bacterium]